MGWSILRGDTKTQVSAEAEEVAAVERFCQDIRGVVAGPDLGDSKFVLRDHVADMMEFNPDVFDMRVEDVVFSEPGGGIVVTV
jgi:hypothetical protein